MPAPELSIVIPALNEEQTIGAVLNRVLGVFGREGIAGEVIIVDGCSTDRTGAIADEIAKRDERVCVIHLGPDAPGNLGSSLREGFRNARGSYVIALDCDLSHDPDEIPKLLKQKEEADLIIGSRFVKGGRADLPWKRALLTRSYNFLAKHLLGLGIDDLTTGYRLYKKEMLDRLRLESTGFGLQVEIVVKSHLNGYTAKEVPIHYHRSDKKSTLVYRKQFASYMSPVLLGLRARLSAARAMRN